MIEFSTLFATLVMYVCTCYMTVYTCGKTGWRRDMDDMILQVEDYVAPNSELTLYSQLPVCEREVCM